jgi:DNA polymerase-3 subunit alpha
MPYVPLHVHSIYSNHESIMTPREIVQRAAFLGFEAIALTDHWSTYGHFEFFEAARAAGIAPVLGAEVQHVSLAGSGGIHHLTLLAENDLGYRNLCALVSRHFTREKEPHVTGEELAAHAAGLIALTGCARGEASAAVLHGNIGRARDAVVHLAGLFGPSNVFIEVMSHGSQEESLVADQLRVIATKTGVPTVVTNDDRYLLREDAEYFRIAQLLNRKPVEERVGSPQEHYLKRGRDLAPLAGPDEASLARSGEIAARCRVDLVRAGKIPFSVAANPHDALVDMCRRRFLLMFHDRPADERVHLLRTMERELTVALDEGLSGFLVFLRELFMNAMNRGIWIELMGGTLLQSVVAYLLEVGPLNPVDHELVFESFSPAGRGTIPPVELIISELQKEQLAGIIAGLVPGCAPCFQIAREETSVVTIAKEIADALGEPPELREELARILSFERRHRSLAALLGASEAARGLYNADPGAKRVLHAAFALQGKLHHFTLDTSRLLILPREMDGFYSVVENSAGERFAQLGPAAVERCGGCAMGVQHSHFLSAIEGTIESIQSEDAPFPALGLFKGSERKRWMPDTLDDPPTYALISSGETTGVYLLESQGIRGHLLEIKPEGFAELVNVISLYRPGPLEGRLWEKYIGNAEKKGKVLLPHASLAPVLAATRGVLLYREQVREVIEETTGLRGREALVIETALWSRDSGELVSARLAYVRGAMDAGLNEEDGQRIFDFLLHNVPFTHSKSLSCAQASVSYRTAYLKAHCFERYFTALLNANAGVKERESRYLAYLRDKEVAVAPWGINEDAVSFAYEDGVIKAPIAAVVPLGKGEWDAIVEERIYRGDFASFEQFLARMRGRLPAEASLALVDGGVFDGSGLARETLRGIAESFYHGGAGAGPVPAPATRSGRGRKRRDAAAQTSLFGPDAAGEPEERRGADGRGKEGRA